VPGLWGRESRFAGSRRWSMAALGSVVIPLHTNVCSSRVVVQGYALRSHWRFLLSPHYSIGS
jgi:hypothetical protein